MNEGNEMFEISMYAKEWKRNCLGIVFWGGGGGGGNGVGSWVPHPHVTSTL